MKKTSTAVAKAEPTSLLSIIASAAANPSVDVEKMKALLEMQRSVMAEDARIAFTEAFIGLQLPSITRDGKIDEGTTRSGKQGKKTQYATFENINKVVEPILRQKGFALWFEPDIGDDGRIVMRGHLDHIKGHGKTCAFALPPETQNKNSLQAIGSSLSYGKRYATIALLNIISHAPEDRDLDGNEPQKEIVIPVVDEEGITQLLNAMKENGVTDEMVLKKFNISRLDEMKASDLPAAIKACSKYGATKKPT